MIRLDEDFKIVATEDQKAMMVRNTRGYQKIFETLGNTCRMPGCAYPIRPDANEIAFIGAVCNLCYAMHHAVYDRAYFIEVRRIERERKKGGQ